jgi:hypothetical protein
MTNLPLEGKNPRTSAEFMKSIQKFASTKAGESSIATSERVSINSKYRESKMSSESYNLCGSNGEGVSGFMKN